MQPSTSAELTGSESGSGGGGTGNPQSDITQALGFVTEFNENAQLFNEILLPILILHDLILLSHAVQISDLEEARDDIWRRIAEIAAEGAGGSGDSTNRPSSVDTFTE